MATIKYSRKEIEKCITLTKDNLDKISMFGTPVESLSQNELEIEIFPNRADLIPIQGFIRAINAFLGKETGLKRYKVNKPKKDYKLVINQNVKPIRPHVACCIVRNLKLSEDKIKEIIYLQEKMHATLGKNRKKLAIGIYPLDKIKLPISYESMAPSEIKFIPLDYDKELTGQQILKRHPVGRAYAHLLDKNNRFPVFRDAENKILSLVPIINSQTAGKVTEETKNIFVECSGYDLNVLNKTINIISTSFADMGGEIWQMRIEDAKKRFSPELSPKKKTISLEKTNKLLGLNIKEKELSSLLARMGHEYKKGSVFIPAWRADILHENDLIEEVAIAYGYENFNPIMPSISTTGKEERQSVIARKISEILSGLGLLEISTLHLIKEAEAEKAGIKKPILLEESKTEYKILRPNLFIPLLRTLSENTDAEYPQKVFEMGKVFETNDSESGMGEKTSLIIALTPGNFTEAKQHLDYLFKEINLSYSLKEHTSPGLIEGRTGQILFENKPIGLIGEIHPNTLNSWRLKMPLAVIEISFEEIFNKI